MQWEAQPRFISPYLHAALRATMTKQLPGVKVHGREAWRTWAQRLTGEGSQHAYASWLHQHARE
jgi:hypothetical protein